MINKFLTANDDWIESTRRYLYPRIHGNLSVIGGVIGIPLYATGKVRWNQYVGRLDEDEKAIENELDDLASVRNPIAALKSLPDGRTSEGSWVVLHDDVPDLVDEGMQLHLTLFKCGGGKSGREVYAHYEDDWRSSAIAHLRSKNFSAKKGVGKAKKFFGSSTFLELRVSEVS